MLFHYVYKLRSMKDDNLYIGYTKNLKRRLEEHERRKSFATAPRRPWKLIYFEGCIDHRDAKRREHYLKTTQGHRFIGLRLTQYQKSRGAFGAGS